MVHMRTVLELNTTFGIFPGAFDSCNSPGELLDCCDDRSGDFIQDVRQKQNDVLSCFV